MTVQPTVKENALRQLEEQWNRLLDLARGLSDEAQQRPNATGDWSVRDLMGHIATWDRDLVNVVSKYLTSGEKTDYGDDEAVNRYNEAEVVRQRSLTQDQLWDEVTLHHDRLVQFLRALPEEPFDPGTYSGGWIATDSWGHYREHRQDLEG
ncbi:MAG: maleylpyruvate isomerase N-terminal domain-containing protein [Chloroflexi bacterium]|nr:maleylpyruvate isomerase N-terminal domain-containing protein [Chloroflexota bacterium]MCZ6892084.1 maleylpyruvate isomerase N-terminal domain-containing protein [Chloroflexota bacterium]